MAFRLIVISTLYLLIGCSGQAPSSPSVEQSKPELSMEKREQWSLMSGKWYGSQPIKGGGTRQHIVSRSPDGTYRIQFRTIDTNNHTEDTIEAGHWGVSGSVYFTIFRGWIEGEKTSPADPSDPYNYDAYKIKSLTNNEFIYEHFGTKTEFKINKVPQDFKFPK